MMKKVVRLLLILVIASIVILPMNNYVFAASKATTLGELKAELASWKKKKAQAEKDKKQTKQDITSTKNNITSKENQIQINQDKVTAATNETEKLDKEIAEGKEKLEKMVKNYQVAKGDNVYLEYVFSSSSYEELVYRYAIIEQIMNYQEEQITTWKDKIEYNNQLKKDLAAKEVELNNQIDSLSKDIDKLANKMDELDVMWVDINAEIESDRERINYLESIGCKDNESIEKCLSVAADKTFRRPLKKGTITSNFGYRTHPVTGKKNKFHSGTDIGVSEGSNVYAIAKGTVVKLTHKAECGGNMVYIEHVVNGKQYTSCYMHLLTIKVRLGQKVTNETVIGLSGGKTTAKKKGGYDKCTTGGHLHLSLSKTWYTSYSKYRANLIDPKKALNLPHSWSTR